MADVATNSGSTADPKARVLSADGDRRARVLERVIKPGGVGVECGVYKGEFSLALLERLAPSRLYLIDPWYLVTREWHWGEGDRSTVSALCNILRRFEDELVSGRVMLRIEIGRASCRERVLTGV